MYQNRDNLVIGNDYYNLKQGSTHLLTSMTVVNESMLRALWSLLRKVTAQLNMR